MRASDWLSVLWNSLGVYVFFFVVGWRHMCLQQLVYICTKSDLEGRLRTFGNEALELLFRMWKTLANRLSRFLPPIFTL